MKIGILGGTFDPVHYGHLIAAEECRVRLGLDRIIFVPTGEPPHKRGRPVTPGDDRVTMVELAIWGHPFFEVSRIEVDRPGPSFTVDTLRQLQAELGSDAQLFFIIGMDSLIDLVNWRAPAEIVALAQVITVTRPGFETFDLGALEAAIPQATTRIHLLAIPELNIAASDLRKRVAEGWPIRYQVPEAVAAYIAARGLYRD